MSVVAPHSSVSAARHRHRWRVAAASVGVTALILQAIAEGTHAAAEIDVSRDVGNVTVSGRGYVPGDTPHISIESQSGLWSCSPIVSPSGDFRIDCPIEAEASHEDLRVQIDGLSGPEKDTVANYSISSGTRLSTVLIVAPPPVASPTPITSWLTSGAVVLSLAIIALVLRTRAERAQSGSRRSSWP